MKKTLNRSLSLLLALVLAVSLAVPALAADEPVTLDQTKLSLSPKQSVVLHATRSSEYQDQRITWKSSDTSVATLSDQDHKKGNVTITAKKKGTTAITASVGGYLAVCNVTVEDDYVTDVTITPAGPETLPVGKTRQLEAEVVYAHGTHFVFPEGMLKTMLPVGSGLFVKFAFQAAKKYPKECCQTRKDIEKRMCRVLAEQKGAK